MEHWRNLYDFLKTDQDLNMLVKLIDFSQVVFLTKTPSDFAQGEVHQILIERMRKLCHQKLESLIDKLPALDKISAKVIKATKSYTLALLIIPANQTFGWHNHHKMNGVSRCIAGELVIRSIDRHKLTVIEDDKIFSYQNSQLRVEKLTAALDSISVIYPDTFNIHEIKAGEKQSAFIDLLIPEYPDGDCEYMKTLEQSSENLTLQKVKPPSEMVVGLDNYLKSLKKSS